MGKYTVHRLDANALEIRYALERVGATVDPRCPGDWLVGFRGANYLLEVKTRAGQQNASQQAFQARWKGHYALVRTVDEAFGAIGFTPVMAKGKH
jgi:hypothetical protein